ncbi:hypothetical protein TNCV_720871 [Trichonephila clavipes]|nr:hypothetical protein TNCV_720871 [Trichonephila clavipes]
MKTSSVEFISRSPTPSPMERKYRRFAMLRRRSFSPGSGSEEKREIVLNRRQNSTEENIDAFSSGLHGRTTADSVQSGWPLWHAAKSKTQSARAGAAKQKLKLLDIRAELEREKRRTREVREQALPF